MDQYEHRMNALRHGEFVPAGEQIYDANADLKAHQSHHKRKTVEKESYLSREQLLELRKVQNERIEVGHCIFCHRGFADDGLGWQNEVAGNGYQTKHGCADGWDRIR